MPLTREIKKNIIGKFGKNEVDAGSSEVQIAMLTERINGLRKHFENHKKDHHSRRGLVTMVSKRRKLLKYLKKVDFEGYVKLIKELGIRR